MKYSCFKKAVIDSLSKYKTDVLGITENGEYRGKIYAHILPENMLHRNLLEGVHIPKGPKLHMYAHHLNSSQIMCINFFEPLTHDDKGKALLLAILDKAGTIKLPPNAKIAETSFEKVINREENTNFDFYIKLATGEQVFFEIKYTEDGFGKTHPDKNSPNKYMDKWDTIYKKHLEDSFLINEMPRRIFYENYQIWRNVSYIKKEKDYVVFLFPFENQNALKEIQNTVKTNGKVFKNVNAIDWDWLTDIALELSNGMNYYQHFVDFKEKYLSYKKD